VPARVLAEGVSVRDGVLFRNVVQPVKNVFAPITVSLLSVLISLRPFLFPPAIPLPSAISAFCVLLCESTCVYVVVWYCNIAVQVREFLLADSGVRCWSEGVGFVIPFRLSRWDLRNSDLCVSREATSGSFLEI
jgi:hypothetical protein